METPISPEAAALLRTMYQDVLTPDWLVEQAEGGTEINIDVQREVVTCTIDVNDYLTLKSGLPPEAFTEPGAILLDAAGEKRMHNREQPAHDQFIRYDVWYRVNVRSLVLPGPTNDGEVRFIVSGSARSEVV